MPFRDVAGHRRLRVLLARSVEQGTLPPSLIFSGTDGIGKRLVATAVAQALNCLKPRTSPAYDACGGCGACTRIARGIHPDVLVVEPGDSGSIRIEQVRDVIDRVAYRPFEGRRRVVIIDEADLLVGPAQNALLKTLEEPPSSSVFVLVTARPDALLATVRSRCPRLQFRPLAIQEIATILEGKGVGAAEARAAAAAADGSPGRALRLSAGELVAARDVAVQVLAQAVAAPDAKRRLEQAKELAAGKGAAATRLEMAARLRAMASLIRDVELLGTGADRQALGNPDVLPQIERLRVLGGERGVRAFKAVDEALLALERNAGVKVVADWVVLQL